MKRILTILFAFLLIGAFQANAQNIVFGGAGDPNGEFDGGLNDWKTIGLGTCALDSADTNAAWIWKANGTADAGTFWGTRTPIESASVDNGAAVFNSDFLDTDGVGAFGAGPCPAPHVGILESPVIDCSSLTEVNLWFSQYWREFFAEAEIHVSNNGGMTFDSMYVINTDVAVNAETRNSVVLSITDIAAGEDDVVIRFVFDGTLCNANGCGFYYWIIDDVEVSDRSSVDDASLVIDEVNRQPFFPNVNYRYPSCLVQYDTFGFGAAATLATPGGIQPNDATGVSINVVVQALDADFLPVDTVYSNDTLVGALTLGDTVSTTFGGALWVPAVPEGNYRVLYNVTSDQQDNDFNLGNNSNPAAWGNFVVDDNTDPGITSGISSDDYYNFDNASSAENWYVGSLYSIPDYDCPGISFLTREAEFASAWNDFAPYEIQIFLFEISDEVDASFANFTTDADPTDHPDLTTITQLPFTFENDDQNFTELRIELTDFLGEPIELKPGTRYLLMAQYTAGDGIFHGFDDDRKLAGLHNLFYIDNDDDDVYAWEFFSFINSENLASTTHMYVTIEGLVDADEVPLPENTYTLFPNPVVNSNLNVSMDFAQATDGMFVIYDQNGKVLLMEEQKGMMNQTLNFDVNNYAPGAYFIRLVTEEGSLTKEFVIQK